MRISSQLFFGVTPVNPFSPRKVIPISVNPLSTQGGRGTLAEEGRCFADSGEGEGGIGRRGSKGRRESCFDESRCCEAETEGETEVKTEAEMETKTRRSCNFNQTSW